MGDPGDLAGIGDEVAGGEVVRAVEHQIAPGHELQGASGVQAPPVLDDLHVRIQLPDPRGGRCRLGPPHRLGAVDDLALEVGQLHVVVVDDRQGPDPRGGEVEQRRGAERPGAYAQHRGRAQAALAELADLRDAQVARVAAQLLRTQLRAGLDQRRQAGGAQRFTHCLPPSSRCCSFQMGTRALMQSTSSSQAWKAILR